MSTFPILSLLVFLPWVGALVLALFPVGERASRGLSLAFSLSTLALGLGLAAHFDPHAAGFQFGEHHAWIPSFNVHYRLGLDGLSLLLVLLTGIVAPASLLAPLSGQRGRLFGSLFLLLQGSALGVFLSLDLVQWFLFWELSLVPAFFLIRIWGGSGASGASYGFFVYTMAGSACMLAGFAAIFAVTGEFDMTELARLGSSGILASKLGAFGPFWPRAIFLGVLLGLAVKVPLFPFHTWLPPAYSEAPAGVSMFLTGVMSKMGLYGFLRILWPLFPASLHSAAVPLLWLALGGALFGAWCAMRQEGIRRMLAYSSLNHLSYCLLALFAVAAAPGAHPSASVSALSGILLQLFSHGLSAAALFYCAGILESRFGGATYIGEFGGVRSSAPLLAGLCGIGLFCSLGLPGLSGFVGEFLMFRGMFGLVPWAAVAASAGLLATAVFLLSFWQRVFHGPQRMHEGLALTDIKGSERFVLIGFAALMILLGILPQILIHFFNPLVTAWAAALSP